MQDIIKKIINGELKEYTFESLSKEQTEIIAYYFAEFSDKNLILALNGELGSGKTAFVTGFLKYFNIETEASSPTFTIVNEYSNNIYHFDVYRIKDEEDFLNSIGLDYFDKGICLIEWADIIKNLLPRRTIFIDIKKFENDENKRTIHIWRK